MSIFFEIIKWIFLFLTIVVWLFFLRWDIVFSPEYYIIIKQILMPWYLVFCGMMFGYIMSRIWMWYDEEHPKKNKIYIQSFIWWIIIGVALALIYMSI